MMYQSSDLQIIDSFELIHRLSSPGTFHILIGKFSYFVIRFLLNSSIVKSDNEIGKVNDKNNMIQKSDNEVRKFWNKKKSTKRQTGPKS